MGDLGCCIGLVCVGSLFNGDCEACRGAWQDILVFVVSVTLVAIGGGILTVFGGSVAGWSLAISGAALYVGWVVYRLWQKRQHNKKQTNVNMKSDIGNSSMGGYKVLPMSMEMLMRNAGAPSSVNFECLQ